MSSITLPPGSHGLGGSGQAQGRLTGFVLIEKALGVRRPVQPGEWHGAGRIEPIDFAFSGPPTSEAALADKPALPGGHVSFYDK